MAIIYDYDGIGERYHQLSGPWFPVKDKVTLNAECCPVASSEVSEKAALEHSIAVKKILARVKAKAKDNQLNDPYQYEHEQVFGKYKGLVMAWTVYEDYLDPITGLIFDHAALDYELAYLEKQHGIIDEGARFRFRLDFSNWVYSQKDEPQWDANPKYKEFIESATAFLMRQGILHFRLPKLLPIKGITHL